MTEKKKRAKPSRANIEPPKFEDGQEALLWYIIEQKGGPTAVAESVSLEPHLIYNWRKRGKVPILYAVRVSKMLNIPVWGLNYSDMSFQLDKDHDWDKTVDSYRLPPAIAKKIKSLPEPDLFSWG